MGDKLYNIYNFIYRLYMSANINRVRPHMPTNNDISNLSLSYHLTVDWTILPYSDIRRLGSLLWRFTNSKQNSKDSNQYIPDWFFSCVGQRTVSGFACAFLPPGSIFEANMHSNSRSVMWHRVQIEKSYTYSFEKSSFPPQKRASVLWRKAKHRFQPDTPVVKII